MSSMEIPVEVLFGKEAAGEVVLLVDFDYRPGSPAHMGSLSYPGHPADPPEMEITTIFWPIKRHDPAKGGFVDDHIEMPPTGIPTAVCEAIEMHILENYDWLADYEPPGL